MDDQRDYAEEAWWDAELKREALAELEHDMTCDGCSYCDPDDPANHDYFCKCIYCIPGA